MVLSELIASQAEALAPYTDKGTLQVYEVTSEDLVVIVIQIMSWSIAFGITV